ncbi:MAG: phosphatase PAP2 family protein [Ilumatobacter sp.]
MTETDPSEPVDVPGQHHLGPTVERFDEQADALLERIRGNAAADRLFTFASHVGDFSTIWHTTNIVLGIRERDGRRVVAFAALIGLESLLVNQGVKRLFRRARPTAAGDSGLRVRQPSTSSFPSGHASAATFAAILLIPRAGRTWAPAIAGAAAIVATSRAYVRIHHASDVVAGVVTGAVLVTAIKRAARRTGLRRYL